MANATLATLTIDGVSMDNNETQVNSVTSSSVSLGAGVWTDTRSLTITKKGLYAIQATGSFETTTTTGAINRGVRIMRNGSTLCAQVCGDVNNTAGYRFVNNVAQLNTNDVLMCQIISSRAGKATTFMTIRLIYPLGG